MKFLPLFAIIFLLASCAQTTLIVPDTICNVCKKETNKKIEEVPEVKVIVPSPPTQQIPPRMQQQGWRQEKKQLLCGVPAIVLSSIKMYKETPYMVWQDPKLGTNIMLFMNIELDTLTVVEHVNDKLVCVLTNGIQIHIEEQNVVPGKTIEIDKTIKLLEVSIERE